MLDQYRILFSHIAFKSLKAKLGTSILVFATLGKRQDTSPKCQADLGIARGSKSKPKNECRECLYNPHGKAYYTWKLEVYTCMVLIITSSSTYKLKFKLLEEH
jgi:hypothetical protein